jgi:hypothetical protein
VRFLPLTLILALLVPAAASAQTQPTACPGGPFQVLHNDHVGELSLRRGNYTIITGGSVTCARAARLFSLFLRDYDGRLPRPWTVNAADSAFQRGTGEDAFAVRRTSGGGSRPPMGTHPADGTKCGATFLVQNNDRIGRLSLPRGRYNVTLLEGGGLSCPQASRRFAEFLERPAGNLPSPWAMTVSTATFRMGRGSDTGFRVKPVNAPS